MLACKKQITTVILLLLIAVPLLLPVVIAVKQNVLQRQRKDRFESEFLQTINISAEKILWIKPGKEILTDGKLFDVKSFKISGKTVTFTGFYDSKEDKLVRHIWDIHHQKKDSGNPLDYLTIKFLFYPKYNHTNNFLIQNNWQMIASQYPVYSETISLLSYPIVAPPPKYC